MKTFQKGRLMETVKYIMDQNDIDWASYIIHRYCSNCQHEPYYDTGKKNYVFFDYCPYCGKKITYEHGGKRL